jgi:hypothetical protein
MVIKQSFPKLSEKLLDKTESTLKKRFGYPALPREYREFLLKNNGGFVSPGFADDSDSAEHQEEVQFETSLKWAGDNDRQVTPCIIMFFGIWLEDEMNKADVENWSLCELILSNGHSREEFDVLPENMMSIAKCGHPEAADMLCISLGETDYGSVYYNYGMCDHPAKFHGSIYDDRIKAIYEKHKINAESVLDE